MKTTWPLDWERTCQTAAGVFETTRGSLAAWIADPQTIKPGNNMPMVPLTPDELRAVSAYMAGLK